MSTRLSIVFLAACTSFVAIAASAGDGPAPTRRPVGDDFEGLPVSGAPQATYAADATHALNRLHARLFLTELVPDEVGAALPSERRAQKLDDAAFYVGKWPIPHREGKPEDRRWFGGDVRVSPVVALDATAEAEILELAARFDTVEEVRATPELASPLARLMFQWDVLQVWWRLERKSIGSDALRASLARVVRATAQPKSVLTSLPSGLDALRSQFAPPANAAGGGSMLDRRAPFLDAELLAATGTVGGPWVEVQRRSTALFDAQNSLRAVRAFLRAGTRDETKGVLTAVANAKTDADLPKLPRGTEVALVLTLVGLDEELRPVATPVIDELRLRALAGEEVLSADNDTSSHDGWNQWLYLRTRRGTLVAPAEGAFRFVPDTAQSLFLEYGSAKHTTYAAQCSLCHRATNGGGQAPSGVRMLSRHAQPVAIDDARIRFDQAEREFVPVIESLRRRLDASH